MDEQTKSKLANCKTLGELLKVIEQNYQVESTFISPITKGTIITGLSMAVTMTKCKKR